MVSVGIGAALVAASLQAGAHALIKGGGDKLVVRCMVGLTCGTLMLPFLLLVPLPGAELWFWLAVSSIIHTVYQLMLIRAYELGDFSLAYPVARGVAPVSAAAGAFLFLGERLPAPAFAGTALVSLGLISFLVGERAERTALAAAAATGLLITVYTIVDARGVRAGGENWTFVPWFFVIDGVVMTFVMAAVRGRQLANAVRVNFRQGVTAGIASLGTYSLALVALKLAPVGAASALRETSVVYGLLIARFWLRETVSVKRMAATLCVLAGSLLVALTVPR
jgi:drug/metabolite transporter (DMT)-like permease